MRLNWFYIFIVVMFAGMLFISFRYFRGSGHASVGIAASKEYKITAQKNVVIAAIYVSPGQEVSKGQKLIELTSADLTMDIDRISNKIATLESEQIEKKKLAETKTAYARAQFAIAEARINADINEVKSEQQLNKQLTGKTLADSIVSPHRIKLQSLEQELIETRRAYESQVRETEQETITEIQQAQNQILLLKQELQLMMNEKRELTKYAQAPGVVENVYVKEGEQVSAYAQLISINPVHPVSVVGYLIGKKEMLPLSATVNVRSYEKPEVQIQGKVIGYGSVVELPSILQKSTAVKAFGREVFIEIPADNLFASGEKVLIK